MGLLGRLAFLFVIVPVIELMILIELGRVLGLLPTLLLILLTGAGGAILTRLEGLRVFFQFRQSIAQAQIPGQAILDGVSVLIGGAFLITPGVLTDVLGFSLLLPPSRRWIQRRLRSRLEQKIKDGSIHVVSMVPGQGFGAGFSGSTNSNSWTPKAGNPGAQEGTQPRRTSKNEIIFEPEEQ
ncbi:MAG TPA: FxsA family protein [Gemmatimonadetes bacterium]|jgi:UPF0716 protein FxsA|nr:FxsA family protein [Gemmatimonadota bacterium]HIC63701.1 FxsA family protein [Gemmatimonadota bacterium]